MSKSNPPESSPGLAPKRAGRPKKPAAARTGCVTERERRFGRWKVCPDAQDHDAPWVKLAGYCNTCGHPDPWPRPKWRRGEVVTSNPYARAQSRDPAARKLAFLSAVADLHVAGIVHVYSVADADPSVTRAEIGEYRRGLHLWMARRLEGSAWSKAKQIATHLTDAMDRAVKAKTVTTKVARSISFEANTIHLYLAGRLEESRDH